MFIYFVQLPSCYPGYVAMYILCIFIYKCTWLQKRKQFRDYKLFIFFDSSLIWSCLLICVIVSLKRLTISPPICLNDEFFVAIFAIILFFLIVIVMIIVEMLIMLSGRLLWLLLDSIERKLRLLLLYAQCTVWYYSRLVFVSTRSCYGRLAEE